MTSVDSLRIRRSTLEKSVRAPPANGGTGMTAWRRTSTGAADSRQACGVELQAQLSQDTRLAWEERAVALTCGTYCTYLSLSDVEPMELRRA